MDRDNGLSGGRMTWAKAVSGPLVGCTCLWQDLDGLHVEPAPSNAPPTSILWGWRGDGFLVRTRLDEDTAYVAAVADLTALGPDAGPGTVTTTVPWSVEDGRVAAAVSAAEAGRGPEPGRGGVGTRYEQIIVDGIDTGPITFIRPVVDVATGGVRAADA